MEDKCTRLLLQLKAYTDEISDSIDSSLSSQLIEDVSATSEINKESDCYRLIKLLRELEAAAKTSKLMRERFQCADLDKSEDDSTDAESLQEASLPVEGLVKSSESTDDDETLDSSQETVPSELPVEQIVDIDVQNEDENAEIARDNLDRSASSIEAPEERKTFRVMVDVSNFLAKEISVKVIGKYLVVHGEHKALLDEHGMVSRKFTRKFEIPEDVDAETFRALYDIYRALTIEASLKIKNDKGSFDVPIHEETARPQILSTFKDLGEEFEELANAHIKEAEFMRDFARNLAKQEPSNYIPIEEVIPHE